MAGGLGAAARETRCPGGGGGEVPRRGSDLGRKGAPARGMRGHGGEVTLKEKVPRQGATSGEKYHGQRITLRGRCPGVEKKVPRRGVTLKKL